MPTYEYRCRECSHELEVVQAFSDDPLTECPACGGSLRKKFAAPGIAFKGSGFYKNDSRSSSRSSSGPSGGETSSSSGEGKGDSKGSESPATSEPSGNGGDAKPAKTKSDNKAATPA